MTERELITVVSVADGIEGFGRLLAELVDALCDIEVLSRRTVEEDDEIPEHLFDRSTATVALADGREIAALRLEREDDGITMRVTLLTKEDL